MPGFLLHQGATVMCMHAGQAQPMATDMRVKVSGQFIVTQPSQYTISACPFPPQSGGPCVMAQWVTFAMRVRASGSPVILQDSQSICTPTGTPMNIVVTQMRVKGT